MAIEEHGVLRRAWALPAEHSVSAGEQHQADLSVKAHSAQNLLLHHTEPSMGHTGVR